MPQVGQVAAADILFGPRTDVDARAAVMLISCSHEIVLAVLCHDFTPNGRENESRPRVYFRLSGTVRPEPSENGSTETSGSSAERLAEVSVERLSKGVGCVASTSSASASCKPTSHVKCDPSAIRA